MAQKRALKKAVRKPKNKKSAVDFCQPGFYRFKQLGAKYLLTNELGDFLFLTKKQFGDFQQGKIKAKSGLGKKLDRLDFLKHEAPCERMIDKYGQKNSFMATPGPSLHIVVVTKRCNHRCVYCQTSSHVSAKKYDMDRKTAKKTVDFIFSTPNNSTAIEFQGGEPLLNWPVVKFIIDYARQKNKKAKKNLQLRLVSNYSLMTDKIAQYLFKNYVSLCTSLDGPPAVHNKNRVFGGQSYERVSFWMKKLMAEYKKIRRKDPNYVFQPAALVTISRHSLRYPQEIVDEYLKWGTDNIVLRPMNSFGMAKQDWKKIGYTPDEFFAFYKRALDYIIKKNQQGVVFKEMIAMVVARKILRQDYEIYLDMRSPCGAVVGQLIYFYNGSIYSCDEGRMAGGDVFKMGSVFADDYQKVINNPNAKALCMASCLENTVCDFCAYKPHCGVCPVLNYINYGNIFAPAPLSDRCQVNKKIIDYIFTLLQNPKKKKVLALWADKTKFDAARQRICF